jgi:two-component system NtrC family response regulator
MQAVFQAIPRLAATDAPVLLTGPLGSGKETLARAIHASSRRASRPFTVITCRTLPPEWQASRLFRSDSEDFTRISRYASEPLHQAYGGSLFLEDVGGLGLERQAGLLSFFRQQGPASLAWGLAPPLEVRFISAASEPLADLVRAGRFREDLAKYLSAAPLDLPLLRDRGEDLMILAALGVKQIAARLGKEVLGLARETLAALQAYGWPGNIDELHNRLQRAVVLAEGPWLTAEHLGLPGAELQPEPPSLALGLFEARARFEEEVVAEALNRYAGDTRRAALALQISLAAMKRLVRKYELQGVGLFSRQEENSRGPP